MEVKNFKFEAISDLTTDMSFQMRHSPLLNLKRKSEQDKKSNNDIKNSRDLFEKPGDDEEFENELKDLFKELEHVKTEHSYIELIVQDAETIEKETRKRMMNFFKLAVKFSETDSTTVEQKSQENIIYLFDNLEDDKPQVIDDIYPIAFKKENITKNEKNFMKI